MGEVERIEREVKRAVSLGFQGYCTDCENITLLHNGRCGCGSGRVVTPTSLAHTLSTKRGEADG